MDKTELIIVGGFLGAGKTTSILSLAKHFLNEGMKIGIVTNDQGSDLVDTNFLRSSGLSVIEVTGGCFCCNFDEFMLKVQSMRENDLPDIIIAEPVGSCTDLIASLFKPLDIKFMDKIALRPLSIVVDPKRVKKLIFEDDSDFKTEINYIFKKQLEEADIILLNKIDKINEDEENVLLNFLKENYPGADILSISAKESKNIEIWIDDLYEIKHTSWKNVDVDYDIYGEGEARLGWLNSSFTLIKDESFDINRFIFDVMNGVRKFSQENNISIAHFKVYGVSERDWAKSSITSTSEHIEQNKVSGCKANEWNVIINIRSECSPEELRQSLEKVLFGKVIEMNLNITDLNVQCFSPSKPKKPKNHY